MGRRLTPEQHLVLRRLVFDHLAAVCAAGLPCPQSRDIAEAVAPALGELPTPAMVIYAVHLLREKGRIRAEYRGLNMRRISVCLGQDGPVRRWSEWTGWTEQKPFAPPAPVRAPRVVASTLRAINAAPPASPTGALLQRLIGQGYSPATVARMAGLRPHEMDLVTPG